MDLKDLTRVSGRQVGKNARKIYGCEECNYMINPSVAKDTGVKLKTGCECPRCGCPSIRLFDSIAEHTRACELKILRDAGEIEELEFQPRFDLHVPEFETDEHIKIGTYIADFCYFEKGEFIVEDVKNKSGMTTDVAIWKIKHYQAEYGHEIRIVGR